MKPENYYIPGPTYWPIVGTIGLFCMAIGAVEWLHKVYYGPLLFLIGSFILASMIFGWFSTVINESRQGKLASPRMERTYRIAMLWFIFTEIMFFGAFFAALFYARFYAGPILGGAHDPATHLLLWSQFHFSWPLLQAPDPNKFPAAKGTLNAWGIPTINTAILLTSAVTITIAHWSLLRDKRVLMKLTQGITILLGCLFVCIQAYEFWYAYTQEGLKLTTGIYGTTFFMLTGFHAMHVIVGIIMLTAMLWRMFKSDFTPTDHFGVAASSWYWHFVDVIWLTLFIVVYWL